MSVFVFAAQQPHTHTHTDVHNTYTHERHTRHTRDQRQREKFLSDQNIKCVVFGRQSPYALRPFFVIIAVTVPILPFCMLLCDHLTHDYAANVFYSFTHDNNKNNTLNMKWKKRPEEVIVYTHVGMCQVSSAANNMATRYTCISIFVLNFCTQPIDYEYFLFPYCCWLFCRPIHFAKQIFFVSFLLFLHFVDIVNCRVLVYNNIFNSIVIQYSVFRIYIAYDVVGENVCAPTIGTERCLSQWRSNKIEAMVSDHTIPSNFDRFNRTTENDINIILTNNIYYLIINNNLIF